LVRRDAAKIASMLERASWCRRWTVAALVLSLSCGASARSTLAASTASLKASKKSLKVLFIGNSLTEANELPLMVHALAYADHRNFVVDWVTIGGAALEDHWAEGSARRKLEDRRWNLVVMQQGPSSLPESRVNLREWAARWATVIYANRARPVMFMVWPGIERNAFFDDVRDSYAIAARDVSGVFIPAGEALRIAARMDPSAPLYDGDGFHPSAAGTYAAAASIYGVLAGRDPRGLPSRFRLANGRLIEIPEPLATTLRAAAAEANTQFAFSAPLPAR
jgi:hypothetical protein